MTNKVITHMIPECVTETVPVTRMRQFVEPQVCYVTQKVPVTTMVPVVTCAHQCGHRCGGGCGSCGGVTTCVRYAPVTTCYEQQVAVTRPAVKFVPETLLCPANPHEIQSGERDRHGAGSPRAPDPHHDNPVRSFSSVRVL